MVYTSTIGGAARARVAAALQLDCFKRMADNDGLLTNPAAFVERLVGMAETLKLAQGQNQGS